MNILVIRFSAIGDVAMTVPVLNSFARSFPTHRISLISNKRFKDLFFGMPDNFEFIGVNVKTDYNGIGGLLRLFSFLRRGEFQAVADFHGVLRSRILSALFLITGVRVKSIKKGRLERWKASRKWCKRSLELDPMTIRYNEVLNRLGFSVEIKFRSIFGEERGEFEKIRGFTGEKRDYRWIGIAPFAAHRGKIYPLEMMECVIKNLTELRNTVLFVFAYGEEIEKVEEWEKNESVIMIKGQLTMLEELILMSHLDVMLSMDSSNAHLASLVATPVVSVWGATHPSLGFMGYGQSLENCIQANMDCRPCSVFGKTPCIYKDYRCLSAIQPNLVSDTVKRYL